MKHATCPFLGLSDDPETHQAFPSLRNCCQRARPVEPVRLEHQSTHCLSRDYVHCPMLASKAGNPLPADVRVPKPTPQRNILGIAAAAVILLTVFIVGWQQRWFPSRSVAPTPTQAELLPGTDEAPVLISTRRIAIPQVQTNPQPTPTRSPSLTPAQTETPIPEASPAIRIEDPKTSAPSDTAAVCGPPEGWVIYIVLPNDSLYNIGLKYGVTVTDLQTANCMGHEVTIYTGQKLYVPNVPEQTPRASPTKTPAASATPTEEEIPTNTPEPVATDTPIPSVTPQPTSTPEATATRSPTNTFTPPPEPTVIRPTHTLTPPSTEVGRQKHTPP